MNNIVSDLTQSTPNSASHFALLNAALSSLLMAAHPSISASSSSHFSSLSSCFFVFFGFGGGGFGGGGVRRVVCNGAIRDNADREFLDTSRRGVEEDGVGKGEEGKKLT